MQKNPGRTVLHKTVQEVVEAEKWDKGQELLFSFDQDGNLVIMQVEDQV